MHLGVCPRWAAAVVRRDSASFLVREAHIPARELLVKVVVAYALAPKTSLINTPLKA